MSVQRQQVGATEKYRGYSIKVTIAGPDFLGYVDDRELSAFYLTPSAAVNAAQKFIDDEIKAKERKS